MNGVDHIYFNLTYFNNSNTIPNSPVQYVPAQIVQNYDRDILSNPSEWNVAIARFAISSNYIGRVYQPIGTTGGNTTFYVGLSYNGVYYDNPIVLPTSTAGDGKPVQTVYSVNDFLDLLNTAYLASQASVTAAGGPTGYGQVLTIFEPSSGLYELDVPAYYGTGTIGTTGNGIGVHMSYELYHRFQSFSVTQNIPILYNNHDITFNRVWRGDNETEITYPVGNGGTGPTGVYMQLKQDAPWAASLMDVTRLIITTTTIPIVTEYRAQQLYSSFGGNPGNQTLSILTDFFIGSDTMIVNRAEKWLYVPQFYRISSLRGNTPIRQLDIQIFVSTQDGSIYQLYLGPNDSLDIKLVFMKKGLTA